MNGILLSCLLAVLPGQSFDRVQAESDFRSANELALEGDLDGAIQLYRTLIDRGIDEADLYYNLGNAQAQAGQPIDAILSYERALRRAPGHEDAVENLRFLRKKLHGEEEAQATAAVDVIEPLVAPLSPELFGWMACAGNLLLFGGWFLRRRTGSKGLRRMLGIGLVAGLLALLLGLAVVGGHWMVARDPRAVVVEKTELKEGPHAKFKSKGAALHGGRVRVLDEAEGFLEILQQDGISGWVPKKAITRV